MTTLTIRPLAEADRAAWEPLWAGYQRFYQVQIPAETTAQTWRRILDPQVPVYALGALAAGQLVGIVHYLFHLSTWLSGPSCYLQDLYTLPEARGQGVGRALIAAVADAARAAGAGRLYWLTHESNAQAMALYDKVASRSGFVQYRRALE